MKQIDIDIHTLQDLELLAAAWQVTVGEAVGRLVAAMKADAVRPDPGGTQRPGPVEVHNVYAGRRTEATFDPATGSITVDSGPLSGRTYGSPSGARRAVIAAANPTVNANGNGWDFWTITTTGVKVRTLRNPPYRPRRGWAGGR